MSTDPLVSWTFLTEKSRQTSIDYYALQLTGFVLQFWPTMLVVAMHTVYCWISDYHPHFRWCLSPNKIVWIIRLKCWWLVSNLFNHITACVALSYFIRRLWIKQYWKFPERNCPPGSCPGSCIPWGIFFLFALPTRTKKSNADTSFCSMDTIR